MTWFAETLHGERHGYAQSIRYERELHREHTAFQDLVIFESAGFGRVLVLDGVVQTTERDEFIYHEMLAHVPMFAHGDAKRVLIIGGGDGGILREVLRHPVDRAVMVEIDGAVIERCRELMPSLSGGAFDDPRADVRVADGIDYVARAEDPFDVIIVDSTDPIGPGEVLFTDAFYKDCARLLGPRGIIVTQGGVPFFQGSELTKSYSGLKPHFAETRFYVISVPTYVGGFMTLGFATNDPRLSQQPEEAVLSARLAAAGFDTRYYSPAIHRAAFALPPFIAHLLQ